MSTKHTPGPWSVHPPELTDIYGHPVEADLFTPEYWFIDGPGADVHGLMTHADARLIAAAPDLLEALQGLMYKDCSEPAFIAARVAIKKATGGTT